METVLLSIILAGYLILLLLIGIFANMKLKSSIGFYLAERRIGVFALSATISATVIGGSATIASVALIHQVGMPGLWLDIGGAVGLIILSLTLAKLVRKTGLITLPEIIGKLFDEKTRLAASILIILIQIAWTALLIQATGAILSVITNIDYEIILLAVTGVFILYTILGGQIAVIYTDIIQFSVMLLGVCFIAAPLLLLKVLPRLLDMNYDFLFPINTSVSFITAASFFFIMFFPHLVGPDIYSKLLTANSTQTARKGALYAGIFKLIFAGAIGVIGLATIVLYPELQNHALALPLAILELSPLIAGVVLAAFISVMLSSADSVLLSAGTILNIDIFKKDSVLLSRIGIIFFGVLALVLSLYLKDIIETLRLAYTVFTAGLTIPIIFGFYKQKTKVTSLGAFVGLILGGVLSLIWLGLNSPVIDAVFIGLLGSIIPLLVFRKKRG